MSIFQACLLQAACMWGLPFLQCFRLPFNGGIENIYNAIIDMLKFKPLILLFSICFILCVPLALLFSWIEYIFIFYLICFIGLFDVTPFCHCSVCFRAVVCLPSGGAVPHRTSQYHPLSFLAFIHAVAVVCLTFTYVIICTVHHYICLNSQLSLYNFLYIEIQRW